MRLEAELQQKTERLTAKDRELQHKDQQLVQSFNFRFIFILF